MHRHKNIKKLINGFQFSEKIEWKKDLFYNRTNNSQ